MIQAVPQCTGEGEGAISDTGSTTVYRRGGGGQSVIPEDTGFHGNQILHTRLFVGWQGGHWGCTSGGGGHSKQFACTCVYNHVLCTLAKMTCRYRQSA